MQSTNKDILGEAFFDEHDHATELMDEQRIVDSIIHPEDYRSIDFDAPVSAMESEFDTAQIITAGGNSVIFEESQIIKKERKYPQGIFAPNSLSVTGVSQKTHSTIETVTQRLFVNERKIKKVKTADDALLSSLPTDSLRWIKKRRKINSFEKVALTHFREKQLRDIFEGLDFDGMGTIHLDLVKGAANYAEEKLKPKKGKPVFTNIQGMFAAMDEDGDGTVDFHEFTIAMTGSSKSTMDKATEQDVEKLTKRFIEFANIRRRERAVEEVNFPISLNKGVVPSMAQILQDRQRMEKEAQRNGALPHLPATEPDIQRYQHFRTLFSIGAKVSEEENEETIAKDVEKKALNIKASVIGKSNKDVLIEKFHEELARLRTEELEKLSATEDDTLLTAEQIAEREKCEKEMEDVQSRVRQIRTRQQEDSRRDPEVRDMLERIAEEKRYIREMKKCPWLPSTTPSAVVGLPSIIPQQESPIKKSLHLRLKANKEFRYIKGNPEEIEKERITLLRSQSIDSIGGRHSVTSSRVSGKSWRDYEVQKVLRYNWG